MKNNNHVTVTPAIATELENIVFTMKQDGVGMNNDPQNLQQAFSPAPLTFLLATSSGGKGTVCEEIERQDKLSDNLGFETWGVDKESDNEMLRCQNLLEQDPRFSKIKSDSLNVRKIVTGIYYGEIKDWETGKIFNLNNDNLDDFLAQTEGRYDKEALKILKTWANEEPNHFKEVADLSNEGMRLRAFERAVDHAIENSKNGIPTILDMVPNPEGGDMVAAFEKRLVEKNFTCPTLVVILHLPVKDLMERMEQRNQKALALGGNSYDQRNETFPFHHYATLFGAIAEKDSHSLGILHADDIYKAVEKFGDKDGAASESKELLDRLGFTEGQTSIEVGLKLRADTVFEHSTTSSTTQIAEYIRGWTREQILEGQVRDQEKETAVRFPEKSWVDITSNSNPSRNSSTVRK